MLSTSIVVLNTGAEELRICGTEREAFTAAVTGSHNVLAMPSSSSSDDSAGVKVGIPGRFDARQASV